MTNCPSCGKPVRDGAAFCPYCGSAISAPAEAPASAPAPGYAAAGYAPQPAPEKKHISRMKKLLLILIPAAVVIAAGIALFLILGKGGGDSSVSLKKGSGSDSDSKDDFFHRLGAVKAYLDEDGTAYIPCSDGSCIRIGNTDGIEEAYLSPDGKRVVYLTAEGELYVAKRNLSKREYVRQNVDWLGRVSDLGFLYETEDGDFFRYSFRDGSSVKLGEIPRNFYLADDDFGILYARDDSLYRLPAKKSEPEKLVSSDAVLYPVYLSTDGKTVIWAERTSTNEYTVMLLEGKTQTRLGKLRGDEYFRREIDLSKDEKLAIIQGPWSDSFLIWQKGREAVSVKLCIWNSWIYTEDGPLITAAASGVRKLYVQSDSSIYAVTPEGDKERLLSDVEAFAVSGGMILWKDEDDFLYCGKLKNGSITEKKELDEDVTWLLPGLYGKYFYYYREDGDEGWEICGYRAGDKAPVRIDYCFEESYGWQFAGDYGWPFTFRASLTGDTICYSKEVDDDGIGTLMTWTWGGEKIKIAKDVTFFDYLKVCGSGLRVSAYFTDPKGFWFLTDEYDGYGDLYFWNGKEKTKLASDVIVD